ncbi:MAG: hypothetical protein RL322_2726 [Pseudomonadota bacterium]|jgi:hypothetical protein
MHSPGVEPLLQLPREIARLVIEFVLNPGAGADPGRVRLPAPLEPGSDSVRACSIERGLLGPAIGGREAEDCLRQFQWQSPLHRLAVLPREVLESLAWHLGLATLRDRLRRVVTRDALRALHAEGVSAEHLSFVYQLPDVTDPSRGLASPTERLPAALPADPLNGTHPIAQAGWGVLGSLHALLPEAIALRFRLKCPPQLEQASAVAPGLMPQDPLFDWVRVRVVSAWRTDFDSSLAALATRPVR